MAVTLAKTRLTEDSQTAVTLGGVGGGLMKLVRNPSGCDAPWTSDIDASTGLDYTVC